MLIGILSVTASRPCTVTHCIQIFASASTRNQKLRTYSVLGGPEIQKRRKYSPSCRGSHKQIIIRCVQ